jgi:hypothetical protein
LIFNLPVSERSLTTKKQEQKNNTIHKCGLFKMPQDKAAKASAKTSSKFGGQTTTGATTASNTSCSASGTSGCHHHHHHHYPPKHRRTDSSKEPSEHYKTTHATFPFPRNRFLTDCSVTNRDVIEPAKIHLCNGLHVFRAYLKNKCKIGL